MAKTGAIINVKKAQFLAPHEMQHIINKLGEAGNEKVVLCLVDLLLNVCDVSLHLYQKLHSELIHLLYTVVRLV